jgi:predicted CoA-substrate-specific enzyme activase
VRIGIDIGSCYIKAVALDASDRVVRHQFAPHNGRPREALRPFLKGLDQEAIALGLTGSLSGLLANAQAHRLDDVQAMLKGSAHLNGRFRNLLHLGASSISLIKLGERGELLDYRTNSVCAAGTGSFLDQQAGRMRIDIAECARFRRVEDPPSVAARCSVFAKSDLIHRQQEGYTIPQLWCGLCRGLSFTIVNALLQGEALRGKTGVIGGVALNQEVIRWLRQLIGPDLFVAEHPHLVAAIGAALLAPDGRGPGDLFADADPHIRGPRPAAHVRPALVLKRSALPADEVFRRYVDEDGNEVRILEEPRGTRSVSLGLDIGSTSTKLAILGEDDRVLVDIYRRTAGDPIGATQNLLRRVEALLTEAGAEFLFTACGTTGSGRRLVGEIVGADRIVNEITAHARGARLLFGNEMETLFEIGGQDAKYVHMRDGRVDHVNLNYVCAAGTGSFVEEQAGKLGFRVDEIGDRVLGIAPPFTSERCTVFMERDVEKLLMEGFSREQAMAAVLYSVCFNYLTKVVGNRPVTGEKILFQGATARNKGLVAAFEIILARQIVTSPFCHVTGAIGAARLAREEIDSTGRRPSFRGLGVHRRQVRLEYSECGLCQNRCKITHARIEGVDAAPSWGYMCGREPEDTKRKPNRLYAAFDLRGSLFTKAATPQRRQAAGVGVTMPLALAAYAHLPLWRAFFEDLGLALRVTRPTRRETIEAGISNATADFCFPVKVFLGHVAEAARAEGPVFIPHLIAGEKTRITLKSVFCPYVQAAPSIALCSELLSEALRGRLLKPVVDFAMPDAVNIRELHAALRPLGIRKGRVARAWKRGLAALQEYRQACEQEGLKILGEVERSGEKAVVVLGRYYNMYDGAVNLEIPRKLSELGYRVIPYEFLPFREENLDPFFRNMFWYYGQRILAAARRVKEQKNLFLLYLTNFSCGPDSFLLTYVDEIMGGKPMLTLELDEHSADTGYGTRLEAFADLLATYGEAKEERSFLYVKRAPGDLRDKRILLVPMHPGVVPMFEAAFEKHGYRPLVLPEITPEQFELGRKHTRGSECLPAHITTGNILHSLDRLGLRPEEAALFMPTSDGPCRFGQYASLHRILLNKIGYEDLTILSPSAQNAYMGLEEDLRKDLWKAILTGDLLFKFFCRVAPFEKRPGEAREAFESVTRDSSRAFRQGASFTEVIRNAAARFSRIDRRDVSKPLVGIVGEIFVRCNPFSCDRVVDWILEAGAEPWLAPMGEWVLFTSFIHRHEAGKTRSLREMARSYLGNSFLTRLEHQACEAAGELLEARREPRTAEMVEAGEQFLPVEFNAEAILSVGRASLFIDRDGADMIVNVSPFTCMPGAITAAIFRQMGSRKGIPIVNMYYDGTVGVNERITAFLRNLNDPRR